ncbi:PREDICTED: SAL2 phosphatase-like isoform X2 [Tarenaya hassleriana]|uniref:SAL2 phosphatase-like isoform X2 n=1 Tax=Tarenaya hassleriana TaxID=28532 RepID=UPI00053C6684|nr:PREDICTED: SAL2 phosphatase-like isoform X2 [Tarenaya hassleriana]
MCICSMAYEKELAAAKKAVSLAARLCQKLQRSLSQSDILTKPDNSPVTVADFGSQVVVTLVLQKELQPEPLSLVAEEDSGELRKNGAEAVLESIANLVKDTLDSDGYYPSSPLSTDHVLRAIECGRSEGGSTGRHWVLDPIDGTRGFVRGEQYAVGLALLVEGQVVLGVMACPNLPLACDTQKPSSDEVGCLFSATKGDGSYVQPLKGDGTPQKVQVSSIDNPEEAKFFESYHKPMPIHSSIAKKLGIKSLPVRMDSQAKYGALAQGGGEIYLRFTRNGYQESIWDHAAGSIVTTGGVVMDAAGNALDFSRGKHLCHKTGIIVTTEKLKPWLLKAVKESMEEDKLHLLQLQHV